MLSRSGFPEVEKLFATMGDGMFFTGAETMDPLRQNLSGNVVQVKQRGELSGVLLMAWTPSFVCTDPKDFLDRCPASAWGQSQLSSFGIVTANRDPDTFGDPDRYDPAGNAAANLVYGTGPHVCPGRPLATLELRELVRALLAGFELEFAPHAAPSRALPPLGGWERVPLILRPQVTATARPAW